MLVASQTGIFGVVLDDGTLSFPFSFLTVFVGREMQPLMPSDATFVESVCASCGAVFYATGSGLC